MLEQIIRYEAVHEIRGWDDLRRRLAAARPALLRLLPSRADRRAADLRRGGADARDSVGHRGDPRRGPRSVLTAASRPTTAVFYSISNCQPGLRGISLRQFPDQAGGRGAERRTARLEDFRHTVAGAGLRPLARATSRARIGRVSPASTAGDAGRARSTATTGGTGPARASACGRSSWARRRLLSPNAKIADGRPLDPVARFHLGNGARLERMNWLGDTLGQGLRRGRRADGQLSL